MYGSTEPNATQLWSDNLTQKLTVRENKSSNDTPTYYDSQPLGKCTQQDKKTTTALAKGSHPVNLESFPSRSHLPPNEPDVGRRGNIAVNILILRTGTTLDHGRAKQRQNRTWSNLTKGSRQAKTEGRKEGRNECWSGADERTDGRTNEKQRTFECSTDVRRSSFVVHRRCVVCCELAVSWGQ